MTAQTPKRIAAAIIRTDLELVSEYWEERYSDIPEDMRREIQAQMDKILAPLHARVTNVAKGVKPWEIK